MWYQHLLEFVRVVWLLQQFLRGVAVGAAHDGGEDLLHVYAAPSRALGTLPGTHAPHQVGQHRRQLGTGCPVRGAARTPGLQGLYIGRLIHGTLLV